MNSKNNQISSIWFFDHIHHIQLNFHQCHIHNLSFKKKKRKKSKHRKLFIWKKMVKTWWNSCSKYFFSTIWSFILFNQSITYLLLGVNKLKGNKSKHKIFDMNSKNDTCKMYWPKILTSFNHFLDFYCFFSIAVSVFFTVGKFCFTLFHWNFEVEKCCL